jgi:predicted metal-dependent phosphoesterase TrpH
LPGWRKQRLAAPAPASSSCRASKSQRPSVGYFLDSRSSALLGFLDEQRRRRIDRVRQIVGRLRTFGLVLDAEAIVQPAIADPSRATGRPWIARALLEAGHVQTTTEAFDRWLGRGRPAFIARDVASPADVFARIHEAGGLASLAHPWLLDRDREIATFAGAGLDAIEAYSAEFHGLTTARYLRIADDLGLAVSGGSDYHGDASHGAAALGGGALPPEAFDRLKSRRRGA